MNNTKIQRSITLFRSVLFFSILILMLICASFIVEPKDNKEEEGISSPRIYGFFSEPENTIDVLVVGDSLASYTVSSMELWKNYGFTTYVCGGPDQGIADTGDLIHLFCESQNPKVILWEVNQMFDAYQPGDDFIFQVQRALPVFRYHNHWKTLNAQSLFDRPHFSTKSETKGTTVDVSIDFKNTKEKRNEAFLNERRRIPDFNAEYVKNIVRYCEKKQIKVIFFNAPSLNFWSSERHASADSLANEIGADFIDMNLLKEQVPINWETDTCDDGYHLNYYGSLKTTAYIGTILQETGLVTDRRNDPTVAYWHNDVVLYDRYISQLFKEKN